MEQGNSGIRPTPEETPAQNPTTTEEKKPKLKILGLDEPYEYAPPKPADPWAILLKPELEADKIRCDAWKDEVQNLLIFAGLFSAVVTPFVVESYKFLRPDPNDAIISLLSQIANGPNTTSSAGSITSTTASFTPAPLSVVINVLWILSLSLSLATVLIGTIALQWLREHQSYPGFSPKETLAVLRMRSQALEAWHVPRMFAGFPLLLQVAFLLFLFGLYEFTLLLGGRLWILIHILIGSIYLFLLATTFLPAIQPVFVLFDRFSRVAPTPCPFKSPQSQIFRSFVQFLRRLFSTNNRIPSLSDGHRHLFPHIYTIWHRKTWPTYDLEWLSVRDAWHQGSIDRDPGLHEHRWAWKSEFPLSDVTQCLVTAINGLTRAKHTEEYLISAYHCFEEVSATVFPGLDNISIPVMVDRRNSYFEQLQGLEDTQYRRGSIANFLVHGGGTYQYEFSNNQKYLIHQYSKKHCALFYQDQVSLFLDRLISNHESPVLRQYQQEMKLRLLQYLLKEDLEPLQPIQRRWTYNFLHPVSRLVDSKKYRHAEDNLSGPADLLITIFESIASSQINQEDLKNPIYTDAQMISVLTSVAEEISSYIREQRQHTNTINSNTSSHLYHPGIEEGYASLFYSVTKHLNNEISGPDLDTSRPSLLFYYSAMFLHCVFAQIKDDTEQLSQIKFRSFTQALCTFLDALFRYKERMAAWKNEEIETKLKGDDPDRIWDPTTSRIMEADRFSDEWWGIFSRIYDVSGLRIAKNNSTLYSPPTSANETQHSIPEIAPSSLEDTADNIGSSSPASNLTMPPIPNPILDVTPPADLTDHPSSAHPQPSSSSPKIPPTSSGVANEPSIEPPAQFAGPQGPLILVGSDDSRNLAIPGDSVIDMQPSGVLDKSENRTSADEICLPVRDMVPSSPADTADKIVSSATENLDVSPVELEDNPSDAHPQLLSSASLGISPTSSEVANEPHRNI